MDYYDVLGVPRNASEKDIRQAYRRLARQYHPDVNAGDAASEEKFKQINEAYHVLANPENRRKYDRYGDNWAHADQFEQAQARRGGRYRRTTSRDGDTFFGFGQGQGSVFEDLFADLGEDLRPPRAAEYPVEITLEEAYSGTTRLLDMSGGRRLEVKIPPGVDNGSRVHIPAGAGRQGDIYLVVSVLPHPRFQRQGRDLYCEVDVPLEDAILGGEVTVPTLRGRVALTVPPETQNGRRFRLAGQGMPALNDTSARGHLYATVKVKLPTSLSTAERELFQRLRELRT